MNESQNQMPLDQKVDIFLQTPPAPNDDYETKAREIIHSHPEWQEALDQLMEEEKLDRIATICDENLQDIVADYQRFGTREPMIYVDPLIMQNHEKEIREFYEKVRSGGLKSLINFLNESLPSSYKKFDGQFPTIFIHSQVNQRLAAFEANAFVEGKAKNGIHVTDRYLTSSNHFSSVFSHELTHTLEPSYLTNTFELFNEGVATASQYEFPEDAFFEAFFAISFQEQNHLLTKSWDGSRFDFDIRALFNWQAYNFEESADINIKYLSNNTRYNLAGAFVDWYRQKIDKGLTFLNNQDDYENIANIVIRIAYPQNEVPNPDFKEAPALTNPKTPPPRRRPNEIWKTTFVDTFPDELNIIISPYAEIAVASDPKLAQEFKSLNPDDFANISDAMDYKIRVLKFKDNINKRIDELNKQFSDYMNKKYQAFSQRGANI